MYILSRLIFPKNGLHYVFNELYKVPLSKPIFINRISYIRVQNIDLSTRVNPLKNGHQYGGIDIYVFQIKGIKPR